MITLVILGIYIICGILITGIMDAIDEIDEFGDAMLCFGMWPLVLIMLCIMGVSKLTKAYINRKE